MGGGKVENLTLYTFKREADRALFVPSKAFSGISTWMFAGGALLMLYFSSIFFLHPLGTSGSLWIGAYLPSQYFGVHQPRANLYPFAAKLAEVLEVPVKESR